MKFTNFAPLENARNEAGSLRINGFLYVFSGSLLDRSPAKMVERHNMQENTSFEVVDVKSDLGLSQFFERE
jgi:hypothetical protein